MATRKKALLDNPKVGKTLKADTGTKPLAKEFITSLGDYQSDKEREKIQRYFKASGANGERDEFMGVKMGQVFALAKTFMQMEPAEIEKLLEYPVHEVRVGAVSIMDFQARDKKTTEKRRKELFHLYIKRHDRINNWDLVDRSAPYVVGGFLLDKKRTILYKLARSKNMWERRTSIVATYFFIRQGDVDETFNIAEILINDKEDLIQKAVGSWLRTAGGKDSKQLLNFLDKYAASMPRTALRYSIEHLSKSDREKYMRKASEASIKVSAVKKVNAKQKHDKLPNTTDNEKVSAYMEKLTIPLKAEMEAVRKIIKNTHKDLGERIKWNAPSYYYNGEDVVTFNGWATKNIHLVFHHPAIVTIKSAMLVGDYDKRRMMYFKDKKEIAKGKKELERIIKSLISKI
jgi:3-methyladenine DNA glycosylase AlkD/uncharacterized protein YdhG (YjbR/CyaY superfamily)